MINYGAASNNKVKIFGGHGKPVSVIRKIYMIGMEDRIRAIELNLDVGVIPLACTAEDNLNVASNKYVTDPNLKGKKEFRHSEEMVGFCANDDVLGNSHDMPENMVSSNDITYADREPFENVVVTADVV